MRIRTTNGGSQGYGRIILSLTYITHDPNFPNACMVLIPAMTMVTNSISVCSLHCADRSPLFRCSLDNLTKPITLNTIYFSHMSPSAGLAWPTLVQLNLKSIMLQPKDYRSVESGGVAITVCLYASVSFRGVCQGVVLLFTARNIFY